MHFIIPDLYSVEYLMENLELEMEKNFQIIQHIRILENIYLKL